MARDTITEKFPALFWQWTGEAMKPRTRIAHSYFTPGELYRLVAEEERASTAALASLMIHVKECFDSLPEGDERFATPTHLRKWALCKANFCTVEEFSCETKESAERLAVFAKKKDTYAIILVRDTLVRVYTAESQSKRSMGKEKFHESSEAVRRVLADLLDIKKSELPKRGSA